MDSISFQTAPIYKPLFKLKNKYVIIKGGRDTGKSKAVYQLAFTRLFENPFNDVIVCRDSYSDLTESSYAELVAFIDENNLNEEFRVLKSPLRIIRRGNSGTIYFVGVGGSDKSRTKSFKTSHKVCMVIFEEVQQIKDEESLYQAHASFRRLLNVDNWMMAHIFNPPPQKAHWVNIWAEMKKMDDDYLVIHSSYLDILMFLNDVDIKAILKEKLLDYEKYKWLYLGIPGGGLGSVYPQYKRDKHFITELEAEDKFRGRRIVGMIIGCDGAVNADATAFVPMAIFDNGQSAVLELFYHDPKKSGVKSSSEICEFATRWFNMILRKYGLGVDNNDDIIVPICFKVDSAAADLKRELQRWFGNRAFVEKFKKPSIVEMVGTMQSVFSRNMLYVINYGGYHDYVLNQWVQADNPLTVALENLIWDEKGTGYDPIVPNDASDALTYGGCTYYKNPDNLGWLSKIIQSRKEFYDTNY